MWSLKIIMNIPIITMTGLSIWIIHIRILSTTIPTPVIAFAMKSFLTLLIPILIVGNTGMMSFLSVYYNLDSGFLCSGSSKQFTCVFCMFAVGMVIWWIHWNQSLIWMVIMIMWAWCLIVISHCVYFIWNMWAGSQINQIEMLTSLQRCVPLVHMSGLSITRLIFRSWWITEVWRHQE